MSTPVHLTPNRQLTPAQELLWTSQRLHPDVPLANMATIATIEGIIDPDRFVAAVDQVIGGSDVLRLRISEINAVPYPTLVSEPPSQTLLIQLPAEELHEWMHLRISQPLDLGTSVYDSVLIQHDVDSWSWWMNIHHIATDAASSAEIFRAVADAYHGRWQPPVAYSEFADQLVSLRQTDRWRRAIEYWAEVDHSVGETSLYSPDSGAKTQAERVGIPMLPDRQDRLDALLANQFRLLSPDLSLTVALATALAAYLFRLNGAERIVIGVPVHNRSSNEAKSVIGPLVELFPLVVNPQADDTFATLQSKVAKSLMRTLRHALPGASPRQSFDVVLNVHGSTFGSFGEMKTTHRWIHPGHIDSHHRLRLQALDYLGEGNLELALDINHRAAGADHRTQAGKHFGTVLDAMLADPDTRLCAVGLASADDLQLLRSFNNPTPGTPLDLPAPDAIAQQLQSRPKAAVMSHGKLDFSAGEIDHMIQQTADALSMAGIGRGDLVAIEIPISIDAVVAIHGVLRCGAAFVPIDPEYPEARREFLRSDSKATATLRSLADVEELAPVGPPITPAGIDLDDLAYVIYTSGSTGMPKGVPISHRGLAEYLGFALGAYAPGDQPVMALYTSLSFDLTITTLFLPWLASGSLTIHPQGGVAALREIVDERRVTLLKATPSHLELLVRMINSDHPLRGLIVGGEAFMSGLADRLLAVLGQDLEIFNEYGPTEAVVGCMIHRYNPQLDEGPEVPIGAPAPGVTLHVLDSAGHPVPVGAVGELYVNRPGMASGYLNRPDLSEQYFNERDATVGTKLYRTGDRVRVLDSKRMVYQGRFDDQLKIGGIRVEPGAIETAAQEMPGVRRALASLWRPDTSQRVELCTRCGLGADVPGVTIDDDGVCSACHEFDVVAPQSEAWFRSEDDLALELQQARDRARGDYDVIHLLSGGKDSTYALYRLVSMGARVYALTLDNGFISDTAKENVRRAVRALGVSHEFVTVAGMNEIFRDSLERYSNVCNGCYKTIYTVALERADKLGIPAIVTGLSRGQFFETRLVPGLFSAERFDPAAIDEAVDEARRVYHSMPDAVSENLDVEFLRDGRVLEQVKFIDFFRYIDVELSEMYQALEESGTWQRPSDTGRSTNCLINAAGIHVHKLERAHHNYALPYSWDVRLGHKTRAEALFELDDPMDADELASIASMLDEVGYKPRPLEMLTLWIEADESFDLATLHDWLGENLPAHARPRAIERVNQFPLTANGKIDVAALPAPTLRRALMTQVSGRGPATPTERGVTAVWEQVLGLTAVSVSEDFFAMGGSSLHALEMILRVSEFSGVQLPESFAFRFRTVEELAGAIDRIGPDDAVGPIAATSTTVPEWDPEALTPWEQPFVFEYLNDPDSPRHNVGRRYTIDAPIEAGPLAAAILATVERHRPLRLTMGEERKMLDPEQAVEITAGFTPSTHNEFIAIANRAIAEPFDIEAGPLTRFVIQPLEGRQTGVVVVANHGVTDGSGLDRIWKDIGSYYQGESLASLDQRYLEHSSQLSAAVNAADLSWIGADQVQPPPLLLTPSLDGQKGYQTLPARFTHTELSAVGTATPMATCLAGLYATLKPYQPGGLVSFGLPISVKGLSQAELAGCWLNVVPTQLAVESVERDVLLDEAMSAAVQALEHRMVPQSTVNSHRRSRGLEPLAPEVIFAYNELPTATFGIHQARHETLSAPGVRSPLAFFVEVREDQVDLAVEFDGWITNEAQAKQLLVSFDNAIADLLTGRDPAAGRAEVATDHFRSLTELIARQAATNPAAPAVVSGEDVLSYEELLTRADGVAGTLQKRGHGPGNRVGVMAPRSAETVVNILGVLRSGAAYVPLDPQYPAERLAYIAQNAHLVGVVAQPGTKQLASELGVEVIDPTTEAAPALLETHARSSDEAYVIYTSGSTGRPKGVAVSQANIVASTAVRTDVYGNDPRAFLMVSSFSFDSSMVGLFWTLTTGGTLVVPEDGRQTDVVHLSELVRTAEVTHLLAVPSLYRVLLEEAPLSNLGCLTDVIVAGEPCTPDLVVAHQTHLPSSRIHNEYGPTETTVWSHHYEFAPGVGLGDEMPIGTPVPGVRSVVVDETGNPCGVDQVGELVIGGAGVTRGYIGLAGETADRFGFGVGGLDGPTYRTGDLVRTNVDGQLVFVGRVDRQAKVRGFRVEPELIESELNSIEGVTGSRAVVRSGRIVAWIETPNHARPDEPERIRQLLSKHLPDHEVPSVIVCLASMPRTVNGKVDESQLLVPSSLASTDAPTKSSNKTRAAIAEIWSEVLGVSGVGDHENFFDLGGDSLMNMRIVARMRRAGFEVRPRDVIGHPSVAAIAKLVDSPTNPTGDREKHLIRFGAPTGSRKIFCVHGAGGGVMNLAGFARQLEPDVQLIAIEAAGVDGTTPMARSIDELCDTYIDEILEFAPGEELILAGFSNGGLAAYEMSRRLTDRGHKVQAVFLLDTFHPSCAARPYGWSRHLRDFRRGPRSFVLEKLSDRIDRFKVYAAERLPAARRRWHADWIEWSMIQNLGGIWQGYEPQEPACRTILFSATDVHEIFRHVGLTRQWPSFVETVSIAGDHKSQVEGVNAGALADAISGVVKELWAPTGSSW
ncbi:MAG: amino acid adenylation domain-containing protein [Acidimicrobiales bacterium]|nr:amino acid adenylation domain-containing protein [Acidimicrobiales bacterium]